MAVPTTTIEVVMQGSMIAAAGAGAKPTANVFHYRRSVAGANVIKANIDAAFQLQTPASVILAASVQWTQIANTVRIVDDATDLPSTFAHVNPGVIAGDSEPNFNAVVVQLKTGARGRTARGRKHFAGIPESATTQNVLTGGAVALWQAVRNSCRTAIVDADANTWTPCVLSRKPPAQYSVNPVVIVSNDVIASVLNLTLGTMRRRKLRTIT